jgi:hypothetical protein
MANKLISESLELYRKAIQNRKIVKIYGNLSVRESPMNRKTTATNRNKTERINNSR